MTFLTRMNMAAKIMLAILLSLNGIVVFHHLNSTVADHVVLKTLSHTGSCHLDKPSKANDLVIIDIYLRLVDCKF